MYFEGQGNSLLIIDRYSLHYISTNFYQQYEFVNTKTILLTYKLMACHVSTVM